MVDLDSDGLADAGERERHAAAGFAVEPASRACEVPASLSALEVVVIDGKKTKDARPSA